MFQQNDGGNTSSEEGEEKPTRMLNIKKRKLEQNLFFERMEQGVGSDEDVDLEQLQS